jgi:hypothetical protein
MGHRGIYKVIENGRHAAYYTHWGAASPFSIFNRISMVQELQAEKHRDKSLIDIFAHIGDDGEYHAESEYGEMFELLTVRGRRRYDYSFAHHGELEMRVTLNFDTDTALLEHNPHYSFYKFAGNFFIPISHGLHNLDAVEAYAKRAGIDDIFKIANTYHLHSGMDEVYQSARSMWNFELELEKNISFEAANPHGYRQNSTSSQIAQKFQDDNETDHER